MKNNSLKLSIIIATMNSSEGISRTIESIISQNYENLEIIFIDGCSSDDTIKIIQSFNLNNYKLISEPDHGIADAWNKGLKLSSGDVITMLNSDDFYDEDVLRPTLKAFEGIQEAFIGFGDVTLINHHSGKKTRVIGKKRSKIGLLNGFGFLHPSVFFNREALNSVGYFNKNIKVAMDTDWLLRALFIQIRFQKIPSHTFMLTGGQSYTNQYTGMGEYLDALIRSGYNGFHVILFFLFRLFGHLKKFLLGIKT